MQTKDINIIPDMSGSNNCQHFTRKHTVTYKKHKIYDNAFQINTHNNVT